MEMRVQEMPAVEHSGRGQRAGKGWVAMKREGRSVAHGDIREGEIQIQIQFRWELGRRPAPPTESTSGSAVRVYCCSTSTVDVTALSPLTAVRV